jgi:hypothetical protein
MIIPVYLEAALRGTKRKKKRFGYKDKMCLRKKKKNEQKK